MCKVYNSVGSLTYINTHLHKHGIDDFRSLNEIMEFQKNYFSSREKIISNHELLIEQEKSALNLEIADLDRHIKKETINLENILRKEIDGLEQKLNELSNFKPKNYVQQILSYIKKRGYNKKIQQKKSNFNSTITQSLKELNVMYGEKHGRYQFINSRFSDAVNDSCLTPLREIERRKSIVDEVNNSIYGALGEYKVVKELEKLSDEYYLINDFALSFPTPIYNRQENDYIRSIQIDHILVSPSGIFLIETKNWSEKSLNNLELRSPIQQIRRTSFALFKILTHDIADDQLILKRHHWGNRKIPVRNLIVFVNSRPNEEFQYVKLLTIKELINYITYFKPVFSDDEVREIVNYLSSLNKNQAATF